MVMILNFLYMDLRSRSLSCDLVVAKLLNFLHEDYVMAMLLHFMHKAFCNLIVMNLSCCTNEVLCCDDALVFHTQCFMCLL